MLEIACYQLFIGHTQKVRSVNSADIPHHPTLSLLPALSDVDKLLVFVRAWLAHQRARGKVCDMLSARSGP